MPGFWRITISSLALTLIVGCNYRIDKTGDADQANSAGQIDPGVPIDWRLIQSKVLSSCMGCHSGRTSPYLGDYTSVSAHLTTIWSEVSTGSMPPPSSGLGPLSACPTAVLRRWIDLGAPQTSSVTVGELAECANQTAETPLAEMPLNYQTLENRILKPRCQSCHNPADNSDAGAILFSPYAELIKNPRRWRAPGATSKIVRLLRTEDVEDRMPPPKAGPALSEEEIKFVESWIDAGKPEF